MDKQCNSPPPSSVVIVTTLGNTLLATCSTEGLTVDCVFAYGGAANCLLMPSGRASKATAAPTAA
jgi:hypothetical protein